MRRRWVAGALALSPLLLGGCLFHHEVKGLEASVHPAQVSADSETLVADKEADTDKVRDLVLLKVAQDCVGRGFETFAFMSVKQPKPHLPNQRPDAPAQYSSSRTFNPPSSTVPEIEPGTMVTVKFFKAGDPAGAGGIYAPLIVANLQPLLNR